MSALLTALGHYTYESYLKKFEDWVQKGLTSSSNASPALVEFTKLNWARSQRIHKTIALNPDMIKAAEKLNHTYTWMVITEAWCGDSAQILPVIAEIAKLNPEKIKLYILLRDGNPDLIGNYLTNGAKAIPKLIAVNETLEKEAFVWGPRPSAAQELLQNWKKNPAGRNWDDFEKELHSWYAKDKTQAIQTEFIQLLEGLN
ncbi:thioredoxin family protein [Sediminibacterium sp.]|uniref:thioredoxin family protein n=1 Tax=Sediminibacterium sp. TaxID=1917865 RepID=UPI0025F0D77D|nr:thioredoxin family protein [Sediminibacterium sp.]MBT9484493.1 thioredoxin family protein [Sediminibacterium sp.]